jgi:hypothetical protein
MEIQRKTSLAMKPDEYILTKLREFGYPWRTTAELGGTKNLWGEFYYIWDKNGDCIARALLRGTKEEDLRKTHDTLQLIVDLARYAHTASKAYADLASVVSDVIMEATTNDSNGRTCGIPTAILAKLKSVLFNSELEKPYQTGATTGLPSEPS